MSNIKDLIKEYKKLIDEELKIDRINIEDAQLKLPSRKHYWLSKLINHKIELNEYKTTLHQSIDKVADNVIEKSDIRLTKQEAVKLAYSNPIVIEIKTKISELELLVEYLEKIEKIYSGVSYDISNIISLIKMETT